MAITDNDLETLNSYLDGELPSEQSEDLWRRLSTNAELAAELAQLRHDRQIRQSAFASLEPTQAEAAHLSQRVVTAARREEVLAAIKRGLGVAVAAAACILFGFTVGFLIRANYPPNSVGATGIQMVEQTQPAVNQVGTTSGRGKFVVEITNSDGQVIARQLVDTLQQARDLADDVSRNQAVQRQAREQQVVPVSDQY